MASHQTVDFPDRLVKGRRSLLAFATFAFALRFRIGSSRGLGDLPWSWQGPKSMGVAPDPCKLA